MLRLKYEPHYKIQKTHIMWHGAMDYLGEYLPMLILVYFSA